MIYRFIILSGEQEDFLREIEMNGNQTFKDFHDAIRKNCRFDPAELTSFFLCNELWEKESEITMIPFEDESSTELMDQRIDSLITQKKQKLIYLFDYFGQRGFFIETIDIFQQTENDTAQYPNWIRQTGEAPLQEDELWDDLDFISDEDDSYEFESDQDPDWQLDDDKYDEEY